MRAFLTGGSGFIGAYLVAALRRRGDEVLGLARTQDAAAMVRRYGATPVMGDLKAPEAFSQTLRSCDVVFHLAAARRVVDPVTGRNDRLPASELLPGTQNLLAALDRNAMTRFIVTSSTSVYGRPWGVVLEATPPRPSTSYGRFRVEVEDLCRKAFADAPQKLVIARLTEVFGPGGIGHRRLFGEIAQGRFRLIGDGRALHHISAVQDVVAGLIACADAPQAGGRTLHVGSTPRTLGEIVAAVGAAAGRPVRTTPWLQPVAEAAIRMMNRFPPLARAMPGLHSALDYQIRPRAFDVTASRELLGDYTATQYEEAIALTVRSLASVAV